MGRFWNIFSPNRSGFTQLNSDLDFYEGGHESGVISFQKPIEIEVLLGLAEAYSSTT